MRQVSLAMLQAMMAQDTEEVLIAYLKISHPSLPATIRIAANTEVLHRADGDYMPYGFQINLPTQQEDETPAVTVTIDNTDLEINNQIHSLVGTPTVEFGVVLASSPDVVEAGPYHYSMLSAQVDASSIQATLSYEEDIWTQSVPAQTYNPINSKGLYA